MRSILTLLYVTVLAAAAAQVQAVDLIRLTDDGLFKQRPAWSPDGVWFVFARHEGDSILLYLRCANGTQERRLLEKSEPQFDAVFSPDGKRLLLTYDKTSPNQGDMDLYGADQEGKNLQPVVTTGKELSHEEWPAWSPDGNWIAYTSTREGNQELYVSKPDGSEPRRMTNDPALDAHPVWSPDGTRLAFATNRWGDLEIAAIHPDGSGLARLTDSPGLDDYPAWSPDGRWLALTSNRTGNLEIELIELATGKRHLPVPDPGIDNFPSWTPDGRLTFVSNRSGAFEIYVTAQPVGQSR